jgi:hypothetical protein
MAFFFYFHQDFKLSELARPGFGVQLVDCVTDIKTAYRFMDQFLSCKYSTLLTEKSRRQYVIEGRAHMGTNWWWKQRCLKSCATLLLIGFVSRRPGGVPLLQHRLHWRHLLLFLSPLDHRHGGPGWFLPFFTIYLLVIKLIYKKAISFITSVGSSSDTEIFRSWFDHPIWLDFRNLGLLEGMLSDDRF